MLSQKRLDQTKPYHSKPTLNLLKMSQKKLDFDETFTVALDGCCLKPDQTIQNQTKLYQTKPTLNLL